MSTSTLIDYPTLQGRLAAAYKDGLLIVPGWPRVVADADNALIHTARVTPTNTANLVPYAVEIREHVTADGSHVQIHCTCKGGDEFGLACKHAAITLDQAGLLHDNFTYEILDGDAWREAEGK